MLGTPDEVAETVVWMYVFLSLIPGTLLLNRDWSLLISLKILKAVLVEELLTRSVFLPRVKTGYVTNKVVGVDGGLFPQ